MAMRNVRTFEITITCLLLLFLSLILLSGFGYLSVTSEPVPHALSVLQMVLFLSHVLTVNSFVLFVFTIRSLPILESDKMLICECMEQINH